MQPKEVKIIMYFFMLLFFQHYQILLGLPNGASNNVPIHDSTIEIRQYR